MIAKTLLTLSLFAGWLYIFTQSGISRTLRFSLYTILGFGLYIVWFPDTSTLVANALGIGRGADLIFYTWIAFSFGVLLNVHLKLRQHLNLITRLARTIAIENTISKKTNDIHSDKNQIDELGNYAKINTKNAEIAPTAGSVIK